MAAVALAAVVALIHVVDQGGVPGSMDSPLIARGYWVLEVGALVTACWLVAAPRSRPARLLSIGVALGPMVGYIVSRGPGLPGAEDEIGYWTKPLGLLSLLVEGVLLVVAISALRRHATSSDLLRQRSQRLGV